MKTLIFSAMLTGLSVLTAASSVSAQTAAKPAAKTTTTTKPATTTTAKPATTTKTTTTAKPATAKPTATAAKPAPKPAAAPAPAPAPEPAPAAPAPANATTAQSSAAEGETFVKGSTAVNLGFGLGLGYGYIGYGSIKSLPAMSISVERGFMEGVGPGTIGIGGIVGYKGYRYDYSNGYKASWNNILVAARGTYHYNLLQNPKLDTYGGISLGVRVQTWHDTYYDSQPSLKGYNSSSVYLMSGLFVGARYFFTDNIGAFGEFGYDMNLLKLGLTAKF